LTGTPPITISTAARARRQTSTPSG
jgi:hypothetical protein